MSVIRNPEPLENVVATGFDALLLGKTSKLSRLVAVLQTRIVALLALMGLATLCQRFVVD